jgi:hypothetical protein
VAASPVGDFEHLADVVRTARGTRSQREAARSAGLGPTTWVKLESGQPHTYGDIVRHKVERLFLWREDEFERVLHGHNPRRVQDEELARVLASWPHIPLKLRRTIARLAEEAAAS